MFLMKFKLQPLTLHESVYNGWEWNWL